MKKHNYFQSVAYRLAESLRGLAEKTKETYTRIASKILNDPNFLLTAGAKYSKSWNRVIFSVVRYLAKTENNVRWQANRCYSIDFNRDILTIFLDSILFADFGLFGLKYARIAADKDKIFNAINSKI